MKSWLQGKRGLSRISGRHFQGINIAGGFYIHLLGLAVDYLVMAWKYNMYRLFAILTTRKYKYKKMQWGGETMWTQYKHVFWNEGGWYSTIKKGMGDKSEHAFFAPHYVHMYNPNI